MKQWTSAWVWAWTAFWLMLAVILAAWLWLDPIPVESAHARRYYHVAIEEAWTTFKEPPHTHVCVSGRVVLIRREADGDLHIALEDLQGRRLVAEEIPGLRARGPRPVREEWATACGISRWDGKHRWPEIHPLEEWRR